MMQDQYPLERADDSPITDTPSTPERPFLLTINLSENGIEPCRQFLSCFDDKTVAVVLFAAPGLPQERIAEKFSSLTHFSLAPIDEITPLRAGCIYAVPEELYIEVEDGILMRLHDADHEHTAIDTFLLSAAESEKNRAIAVFFTNWIMHCLEGLKAVREEKGLILHHQADTLMIPIKEQNPYLTYLLDGSLSLEDLTFRVHSFIASSEHRLLFGLSLEQEDIHALEKLYHQLKMVTGVRFADYDLIYLLQHLRQRLQVHGLTQIVDYVELMAMHPPELALFARRLSVRRASLFDNTWELQQLADAVLPAILANKKAGDVVRVWVPSCATGEEVVSIALVLEEALRSASASVAFQVIGTDTDQEMLRLAGCGQYSGSSLRNVPPEIKERYFERHENVYYLERGVLNKLHFSALDSTELPPYTYLDLILCRGLLNRMKSEVQTRVLKHMEASLAPRGFLMLGEGDVSRADIPYFTSTDPDFIIFTSTVSTLEDQSTSESTSLFRENAQDMLDNSEEEDAVFDLESLHKELVLQLQASVSVIVDSDFEIFDQIGNVGLFIAWPNNGTTANLLTAFPRAARQELKDAVEQSLQQKRSLRSKVIIPNSEGILQAFRMHIHPVQWSSEEAPLIQVMFQVEKTEQEAQSGMYRGQPVDQVVSKLEAELRHTKDHLRSLNKQLNERLAEPEPVQAPATSPADEKLQQQNAELKATNKELLALNRDLVRRVEKFRKEVVAQKQAAKAVPPPPPPMPQKETPKAAPAVGSNALQNQLIAFTAKRHEMRTALTSIMGFADLLSTRVSGADNKELIQYIGKAGEKLSESLSALLDNDSEDFTLVESEKEHSAGGAEEIYEEEIDRLLVVDDSDATRRLLSIVLGDRFECELAADANEAIEKAEKQMFKAVVLDINLGKGKSGVELLHHLRQSSKYEHVPFMAVTALASPQDRSMLLGNGFNAYVAKPFQKAKLLTTLDQMLSQA